MFQQIGKLQQYNIILWCIFYKNGIPEIECSNNIELNSRSNLREQISITIESIFLRNLYSA
jgi:hypothetical protein